MTLQRSPVTFCFFALIHVKPGGCQLKFLSHSFEHITLLLKCPLHLFPCTLSGSFVGFGQLPQSHIRPPLEHYLHLLTFSGTNHCLGNSAS